MATLGHLPAVGESVSVETARLTVSGLDGRRVARLTVTPLTPDLDGTAQRRLSRMAQHSLR